MVHRVRTLQNIIKKAKKYLKKNQTPPEGYSVKQGPRGGIYYDTEEHKGRYPELKRMPAFRKQENGELHHSTREGVHGPGTYKITQKDGKHHLTFTSHEGESKKLGYFDDLKDAKITVKDAREGKKESIKKKSTEKEGAVEGKKKSKSDTIQCVFKPSDESDILGESEIESPFLGSGKFYIRKFYNSLCLDFEFSDGDEYGHYSKQLLYHLDNKGKKSEQKLQEIANRVANINPNIDFNPPESYTGPKSPQKYNKAVSTEYISKILELETKFNEKVDFNTFFEALDAATKKYLSGSVPCTRVNSNKLIKILKSGKIKNQMETGTSNGCLDPKFRSNFEKNLFNLSEDLPISHYPKYGYVAHIEDNDDNQHSEGKWLDQYGGVSLVFNEKVHSRTTVIGGDSLNLWGGIGSPTPLISPTYLGIGIRNLSHLTKFKKIMKDKSTIDVDRMDMNAIKQILNGDTYDKITAENSSIFVEAQLHGEITTDDIKSIIIYFENIPDSKRSEEYNILDEKTARELKAKVQKMNLNIPIFITEIKNRRVVK